MTRSELYHDLAHQLPDEAQLGAAFITMVEPHPGFEHEYNRWYEDDHFYAGAMHGPWVFAGRRWVATRGLREARVVRDSPIARPFDAGCYVSTYWITAGHELDAELWIHEVMAGELTLAGRGLAEPPTEPGGFYRPKQRDHVYTYYHRFCFGIARDPGPMQAHHALNHPFVGLVIEVVEGKSAAELGTWLRDGHLPGVLPGSPAGYVVVMEATEFTQGMNTTALAQPDGMGRRLCLVWFLDQDPRQCYPAGFAAHHQGLADSDGAELLLSTPFLPTVPGTDRYVDELR
jgi:hypothetical protein